MIKAFAAETMLRNMLLKKYRFNLSALLFAIKVVGFNLLLLGFICDPYRSVLSSLIFRKKCIDFGYFPVCFRLSTNKLLSKVKEFAKYEDSIGGFPCSIGKNPFYVKKK